MSKLYAVINRLIDKDASQSLGHLLLYKDQELVFNCKTLELPDQQNQTKISRIPEGTYQCVDRWSAKFGDHYHLLDVENRSLILIHSGNYYRQIEGCILVGDKFTDLNKDQHLDVTNSKVTLNALRAHLKKNNQNEFILVINDIDHKIESFKSA